MIATEDVGIALRNKKFSWEKNNISPENKNKLDHFVGWPDWAWIYVVIGLASIQDILNKQDYNQHDK